jgi:hypothetical protein
MLENHSTCVNVFFRIGEYVVKVYFCILNCWFVVVALFAMTESNRLSHPCKPFLSVFFSFSFLSSV